MLCCAGSRARLPTCGGPLRLRRPPQPLTCQTESEAAGRGPPAPPRPLKGRAAAVACSRIRDRSSGQQPTRQFPAAASDPRGGWAGLGWGPAGLWSASDDACILECGRGPARLSSASCLLRVTDSATALTDSHAVVIRCVDGRVRFQRHRGATAPWFCYRPTPTSCPGAVCPG